jgi:GNAT superfamily N-acetyltransferase
MDTSQILELYTRQERIEIEFPGMRKDNLPHLIRHVRPAPATSLIGYSELDENNADAAIDEQIEYFRALQLNFSWKVFKSDQPADLKDRLLARGFVTYEEEAVMVLELDEAPASLLAQQNVDLRPITRRQNLVDVIAVMKQVWGGDYHWVYDRLGGHLEIPNYLNVFVAYVDGRPASTGWVYFTRGGEFASLWGGSTIAEYRGHGLYTALLARRVQAARQQGKRFITIDAGPMSQPIVEKYGFRLLTHAQDFDWEFEKPICPTP